MASDHFTCPCADSTAVRPTWALLRLGRFAHARAGMIALGLALSVAGATAGLIPPCLTKPLMDGVLVPYELLAINNLADLPPELAQVVREDLSRREFLPVLQRILAVSAEADPSQWHVLTDRGETRFFLASEHDVQRLGDFRAIPVDSNGVRYLRELDGPSRRILDRYL